MLSVDSERPAQGPEMTKASVGLVEADARVRGKAITRPRRVARMLAVECDRPDATAVAAGPGDAAWSSLTLGACKVASSAILSKRSATLAIR
jgi:hypothetical protein